MDQESGISESVAAVGLSALPPMRHLVPKKLRGAQCQDGMGMMQIGLSTDFGNISFFSGVAFSNGKHS